MAEKILVVDDEPFMRRALRHVLEGADYEVHEASDGDEGLTKAREVLPSLCVCDVGVPGTGGFEMCEAMRADDDLRDVRVLLLSAFHPESADSRGRRAGAAGFLAKPFAVQDLVDRVRAILDAEPGAEDEGDAAE